MKELLSTEILDIYQLIDFGQKWLIFYDINKIFKKGKISENVSWSGL